MKVVKYISNAIINTLIGGIFFLLFGDFVRTTMFIIFLIVRPLGAIVYGSASNPPLWVQILFYSLLVLYLFGIGTVIRVGVESVYRYFEQRKFSDNKK